jgi:hypothetical protein
MPASYPSSAKTFTTKASNDTVEASHPNDLQAEITAIETALLGTLAHDLKWTDATYDIGKSGATRPRDGFFSRNFVIGGTAAIVGVLTATAQAIFNGGASFAGDLLATDGLYDIGKTGATRFRDLFLSRNAAIGGTLGVTGIATFTAAPAVSAGIQFPAVQAASADANNLDDYEEGSWTPSLTGSTSMAGETYAIQVGRTSK